MASDDCRSLPSEFKGLYTSPAPPICRLPFQVTQGADKIMIVYGFSNALRTIHLDA